MTNYKQLLKKYMQFICDYEGSTLVDNLDSYMTDVEFTQEEVDVLQKMDEGLWDD